MRRVSKLDRFVTLQSFAESANGDPTTGTWSTIASMWAEKLDKGRAENFVSDSEIAQADAAFRVRWFDGIEPTWRLVDGTDAWDIKGVVEVEKTRRRDEMMIVVNRYVPGDSSGVVTPAIPSTPLDPPLTPVTDDIYFGTSIDADPNANEATILAVAGVGTVPAYPGSMYLLIFRLATEADITRATFSDDSSGTNQVGAFTKFGSTLVPTGETEAFNVWVSNQALTQTAAVTMTVS